MGNHIVSDQLREYARQVRIETLKMVYTAQSGHIGGSFSVTEILVALYLGGIMRHNPRDPLWECRDRLIYSKGHASPALYAALALSGYFPMALLETFRDFGSPLQGHPVRQAQGNPVRQMVKGKGSHDGLSGVEFSGGSLGQGLSFGIGEALALKRKRNRAKIFVILGEGDLQEGETHEAIISASKDWAHTLGIEPQPKEGAPLYLDNLICIVDLNGIQNDTFVQSTVPLGDIASLFSSMGWEVHDFLQEDGNDMSIVLRALDAAVRSDSHCPKVVLFKTVKGKGVSFMENNGRWHGEAPNDEEFSAAMRELGASEKEIQKTKQFKDIKQAAERCRQVFPRGRKGTRDAFSDAVIEIMNHDPNVFAIGADLAKSTRMDKVAKRFPDRFFNVGVQEQNMVSIAAGLAGEGNVVFISTFARFGSIAYERVLQQIAPSHLPVIMLLTHAGLTVGKDGKSAQTFEHIALWRTLPGLHVIVPADYYEAKAAIVAAYQQRSPAVIFASRENFPELYEARYLKHPFEVGRAHIHSLGRDATIVACGLMVHCALESQKKLKERHNLEVGVINMASVKPLDKRALHKAAKRSKVLIVAEEHSSIGGLYGAVCEALGAFCPRSPIVAVSMQDAFGTSGDPDLLLREYRLTSEDIQNAVLHALVTYRKQKI